MREKFCGVNQDHPCSRWYASAVLEFAAMHPTKAGSSRLAVVPVAGCGYPSIRA